MGCSGVPKYSPTGSIIDVSFTAENNYVNKIQVHDDNTLGKAVELYQETTNKLEFPVVGVYYENKKLPLGKKLRVLSENGVDFKIPLRVVFAKK